ncbi:uncharacterized protein LOC116350414 [Contarinia nasturtii]|uniref:uncharacterized protein LOC116350414 n=1 Tax=Contarinia nasturtii TaxID=265458 RepID=UPI0012D3EED4|nr:uncharacterized protein LOC116350414 [Contarinia nasturtii]
MSAPTTYKIGSINVLSFYLDDETADVHFLFKVADDEWIKVAAHKTLLAAKSDVFKTMFCGSLKEAGEVKIADSNPVVFKEFLQFFYREEVELAPENVHDGIYLAEKYNVTDALQKYKQHLKHTLTDENVCSGYGAAILLELEDFRKACQTLIATNTKKIFASLDFLECKPLALLNILKLNHLSCTELDVFNACIEWVKTTSGENYVTRMLLENYLGESFYYIDFGSMTLEDFLTLLPMHGNLFIGDDYCEIIQMIVNKSFQSTKFKGNRHQVAVCHLQQSLTTSSKVINRLRQYEYTTFFTNRSICLHQIVCADLLEPFKERETKRSGPTDFVSEVTITEIDARNLDHKLVLFEEKVYLNYNSKTTIGMPVPILIKPDFEYKIEFKQNPSGCRFKYLPLISNVQIDTDVTMQFREKGGSTSRSLITTLNFCRICANEVA